MESFIQRMIEEHAQLCVRIEKLHNYVHSNKSDNDDKIEFANKAIQLAAMKKYEEALYARLNNAGIVMEDGKYFEQVAEITDELPPCKSPGNDYDADKAKAEAIAKCCDNIKGKNEDIDFGDN